ncbi:hypothetical protein D3C84_904780 [compost metagenome]
MAVLCGGVMSGEEHQTARLRHGFPCQPAPGGALAAVAVLEADGFFPLPQSCDFRLSSLNVVGVYEIDQRATEELLFAPAQGTGESRVYGLEIAVVANDAQQVEREREDAVALLFGMDAGTDVIE